MTVPVNSRATQFSAVLHPLAGNVSIGYGVTLDATGTGYVVATTENLAASASGIVEGLVLQAGSARQAIEIQSDARVNATHVPFVGTGNPSDYAILDSLGRVVRSSVKTSTTVGRCAKDGSVTMRLDLQHEAFTPLDLPGLLLWLRADLGVILDGSSNVQTWRDQSGLGNDVAQSSAALRPPVLAAAIGGKGALNFASGKWLENTLTSLVGANAAYSLFVVAKDGDGALFTIRRGTVYSASMFSSLIPTLVHADGINPSSNATIANSASETDSAVNGFYSCHRYVGGVNNPEIFLNGTQRAITSAGTFQATESGSAGFVVGTNAASQAWNGSIAEMALVSNAIATADREQLEDYARTRYAL